MASGTRASSSFMTVTISSGDIWSSCIVRGLRVSVVIPLRFNPISCTSTFRFLPHPYGVIVTKV